MLCATMLSVFMLSTSIQNVIILNVISQMLWRQKRQQAMSLQPKPIRERESFQQVTYKLFKLSFQL
jgi:hypothetical protein